MNSRITIARTAFDFLGRLLECYVTRGSACLINATSHELRSLQSIIKAYLSGELLLNNSQTQALKPYAPILRQVSKTRSLGKVHTIITNQFDSRTIQSLLMPLLPVFTPAVHASNTKSVINSNNRAEVSNNSQSKTEAYWSCECCHKVGNTRRSYREHLNTHRNYCDLPFECTVCSKKYASSSALSRHKTKHQ